MRGLVLAFLIFVSAPAFAGPLSQALAKQMADNPTAYLEQVTALIAGYGDGKTIGAVGLGNVVALARSQARALALARLQGADLDGDGAVSGAEIAVAKAAGSATARGRFAVNFVRADQNEDGALTAAELQGFATAAGYAAFDDTKVSELRAVLQFDANADGQVSRDEVQVGLSKLAQVASTAPGTTPGKKIQQQLDVQRHNGKSDGIGHGGQPVGCNQGAHLGAVGGEQDQRHNGKTQLQTECDLGQDQQFPRPM